MTAAYWAKLWIETLDDPKVGFMSDCLFRRFICFILAAKEYGKDGLLPPVDKLAWRLRLSTEEITTALIELQELSITSLDEDGWRVINFSKFQSPVSGAERTRKSRAKKSASSGEDVTKTLHNVKRCVTFDSASASASVNLIKVLKRYESEIGVITPKIADALKDAETEYAEGWIEAAIDEAALNNARSWSYINAILRRWKVDGFQSQRKNGNNSKPKEKNIERILREARLEEMKARGEA
jgi:DnaD/phage-associated family protein